MGKLTAKMQKRQEEKYEMGGGEVLSPEGEDEKYYIWLGTK